ncbi:hypothetical protein PF001_g30916 [Phytophthora fragariae]|uniref:Uncharacterized protein n=1 Tax=Phytophthora fragariae TaxID=53985 RepID=A0A6A4AZG3_9STRA|nr:hypothetical protein PF001_g30916 [Phytophthora fragariae]
MADAKRKLEVNKAVFGAAIAFVIIDTALADTMAIAAPNIFFWPKCLCWIFST